MVKPIPKTLLPDTVQFAEYVAESGFVNGSFVEEGHKAPVTLSFVRVEELTSKQISSLSDEQRHTHKLYYDVVSSESDGTFEFTVDSEVTYNGKKLVVQKVNPVKAFTLHHYELELI